MSWELRGTFVESCSCEMLCPCWFGVQELMKMDQGYCASELLIRVDSGRCDDVEIGPATVVIGVYFPGPTLFDGGGTARLHFDASTPEDQRRALEPVLQGGRGGPMAVLASLIGSWLPSEVTSIELREEGDVLTATVAGRGQLRSSRLRNEGGHPMTMSNVGFTDALQFEGSTAVLAPSAGTSWSDPDLPVTSFECKSGAVGTIHWRGE
jgi:hypothetical protein